MPKLQRHDYYDVARDMNWDFTYVSDKEVFRKNCRRASASRIPSGGAGTSPTS